MPGAQLITLCDLMEENLEAARKEIDVPMLLREDGCYECCSIQGTWQLKDGKILIQYGPFQEEALAYAGRGFAGVSGISRGGTAFMARKAD